LPVSHILVRHESDGCRVCADVSHAKPTVEDPTLFPHRL
jgi:hypothetical protein